MLREEEKNIEETSSEGSDEEGDANPTEEQKKGVVTPNLRPTNKSKSVRGQSLIVEPSGSAKSAAIS